MWSWMNLNVFQCICLLFVYFNVFKCIGISMYLNECFWCVFEWILKYLIDTFCVFELYWCEFGWIWMFFNVFEWMFGHLNVLKVILMCILVHLNVFKCIWYFHLCFWTHSMDIYEYSLYLRIYLWVFICIYLYYVIYTSICVFSVVVYFHVFVIFVCLCICVVLQKWNQWKDDIFPWFIALPLIS